MKKTLLTPAEVAHRLRLSRRTIIGWLQRGRLSGVKVGNQWRIPEEDLAGMSNEDASTGFDSTGWLDADIGGELPPYDWGPLGPPPMRPIAFRKGKGLVVVDPHG